MSENATNQNSEKPPGATAPSHAEAAPEKTAEAVSEKTAKLIAHPRVQNALVLVKKHPLGAVATVAAAAAFVEVEFAIGILTGLGATALLARKSGPEARQQVLTRGKWALERARSALGTRSKPPQPPAAAAPAPEQSASPPS